MDKWAKLSTGLTLPIAGPIFPKLEVVAPMADSKSKPIKDNKTELIINMAIYNTKKAKILKTILLGMADPS